MSGTQMPMHLFLVLQSVGAQFILVETLQLLVVRLAMDLRLSTPPQEL